MPHRPAAPHRLAAATAAAVLAAAVPAACADAGEPAPRRSIRVEAADLAPLEEVPLPGEAAIEAALEVAPGGARTLVVAVDGVNLVPPSPGAAHRPGEGHLRVLADGVVLAETAATTLPLPTPAPAGVTVELVTNDGRRYAGVGGPLRAVLEVPAAP